MVSTRKAQIVYNSVLLVLTITTVWALLDGGYHIAGGLMGAIAVGSAIASLFPFLLSRYLLKKYETMSDNKMRYKVFGLLIYSFCFPVKLWVIYSNVDIIVNGGNGWAFG